MPDVIYDISRLVTRVLNVTPNGIDWIDSLLAGHFLSDRERKASLLRFGWRGPRLFAPGDLPSPTTSLEEAWGLTLDCKDTAIPAWLLSAIAGGAQTWPTGRMKSKKLTGHPTRALSVMKSLAFYGLRFGADPRVAAPVGAIYINSSHFPLDWRRHVEWLNDRLDIKPIFFVHDLLPVLRPELFWKSEPERHARRLELLARRGAAAIVASKTVERLLNEKMMRLGRLDLPIFRASPPIAPIFLRPCPANSALAQATYFVVCGTIEPRKNHLLLLNVWRRLVASHGEAAPRLVIIGKRGWQCAEIVAAIEDPALFGYVIEANGLSTAAYREILGHARALLSPSVAEGFGLPVAEALAAGTPAIVSDIQPHRENGGAAPLYLDPHRPDDWLSAIEAFCLTGSSERSAAMNRIGDHKSVGAAQYLSSIETFLAQL